MARITADRLARYDTRASPFLDTGTPVTKWCDGGEGGRGERESRQRHRLWLPAPADSASDRTLQKRGSEGGRGRFVSGAVVAGSRASVPSMRAPAPRPRPQGAPTPHLPSFLSLFLSLSLSLSRELFKLAVLLPLVPLRIAAALSACVVLAALSWTAAAGWNMEEPLPRHRRALAVAGSKLAGVVLFCLGFSVRVEGKANIRAGKAARAVAVFNHVRRGGGGGGETLRGG